MRAVFHSVLLAMTSPRTTEVLTAALSASPWALLIRQYLFDDWEFAGFLFTLIVVDTATGVLRSWRQHKVSSRAFSRIFLKVLIYMVLLILAHVMTSFKVQGEENMVFKWFDTFIYCAMMAREALSVLENLAAIEPTLIPKALLKRLAQFSEDPQAAAAALALAVPPAPDGAAPLMPESLPVPDTILQPAPSATIS
ncbi:bacteriophage holin [Hymenobacter psychrotolerans]|uniref:Toxin secretion/phage lysis holin n=1 Tax=Hymenobacter psychrotolerans DSM 18569 TaxID=1121959 RepID=A0A1M6Z7I4_9BACT|nr:bacteriophage holin [Hymenobacter psychrotolerans]SHL26362.1 toxin secretion/phage lysis holin [Hymenobacter psychrotolerans DSM 18569]